MPRGFKISLAPTSQPLGVNYWNGSDVGALTNEVKVIAVDPIVD